LSSSRSTTPLPPDLHSFPTRRSSDLHGGHIHQRGLGAVGLVGQAADAAHLAGLSAERGLHRRAAHLVGFGDVGAAGQVGSAPLQDRKSTRLNSSHVSISYAVFCLKNK